MAHVAETAPSPRSDLVSWLLTVVTAAMLLIIGGVFFLVIPKFEMIYKDLGIALPGLTEWMISIMRSGLWMLAIVFALANVAKEFRWNGYPGIGAVNVMVFFIVFCLSVATVIGLFLPIIGIMENIGANRGA